MYAALIKWTINFKAGITMKKIIIIGSGGSGKSTFARKIGKKTGIQVFHLDKLYWKPGWIETGKEEWVEIVKGLTLGESWIIDGNYNGTMDIRVKAADTIIFLDYSRYICLWGALKRRLMYSKKSRPDMAEGCKEKLDMEFFKWIWTFPYKVRTSILKRLNENSVNKKVVILKNRRESEAFLNEL